MPSADGGSMTPIRAIVHRGHAVYTEDMRGEREMIAKSPTPELADWLAQCLATFHERPLQHEQPTDRDSGAAVEIRISSPFDDPRMEELLDLVKLKFAGTGAVIDDRQSGINEEQRRAAAYAQVKAELERRVSGAYGKAVRSTVERG